MHFRAESESAILETGSTNGNFASEFSPSAALPRTAVTCSTYEEILDGIHGLSVMGDALWYGYMTRMTDRLREFVSGNKKSDPNCSTVRVRLTLMYANKWRGAALGHLQLDDPSW
ncbi:hypothetical protein ON010_g16051 [Phytophthora cinnamomi]|nr:hypothetical protein ON010_g16051 [Phytophthora cinnamomi]